jgi:hypothetical protein
MEVIMNKKIRNNLKETLKALFYYKNIIISYLIAIILILPEEIDFDITGLFITYDLSTILVMVLSSLSFGYLSVISIRMNRIHTDGFNKRIIKGITEVALTHLIVLFLLSILFDSRLFALYFLLGTYTLSRGMILICSAVLCATFLIKAISSSISGKQEVGE